LRAYLLKKGIYSVTLNASNEASTGTKTRTNYIKVTAVQKPVESFISNVTSRNAPFNVGFDDAGTETPTSWKWSFEDGTYSTQKFP